LIPLDSRMVADNCDESRVRSDDQKTEARRARLAGGELRGRAATGH
jgi:hypothetical protein